MTGSARNRFRRLLTPALDTATWLLPAFGSCLGQPRVSCNNRGVWEEQSVRASVSKRAWITERQAACHVMNQRHRPTHSVIDKPSTSSLALMRTPQQQQQQQSWNRRRFVTRNSGEVGRSGSRRNDANEERKYGAEDYKKWHNTQGVVTSQNLWPQYDRHFVGITRHMDVWGAKIYRVV